MVSIIKRGAWRENFGSARQVWPNARSAHQAQQRGGAASVGGALVHRQHCVAERCSFATRYARGVVCATQYGSEPLGRLHAGAQLRGAKMSGFATARGKNHTLCGVQLNRPLRQANGAVEQWYRCSRRLWGSGGGGGDL